MYVYILTNHINTVLYTGVTNNLIRRLSEHIKHFSKESFVTKYRLYKLVWFQEFNTPIEAIEAEKKIKGWKRYKKLNLITQTNRDFKNLLF